MGLPEQESDGSERRIAPRMRVLKRAKIIFNHGFSTFDCVIRNVSATGALLTLAESAHMPKEFQIKIGEEPPRPARLVYRRTMFAGIRFADIADETEERTNLDRGAQPSMAAKPSALRTEPPAGTQSDETAAPAAAAGGIARIKPERFPATVTARMPWNG